ncbi:MAG: hypothetical protein WC478_02150 [Candidatus Omnitrophota bacterium]
MALRLLAGGVTRCQIPYFSAGMGAPAKNKVAPWQDPEAKQAKADA